MVINFLNLTLEGVESNPGPTRFSLSSDYSDSVGSNSSTGLRNFTIKKSMFEKLYYKEINTIQASHHQGHLKEKQHFWNLDQ